jgi:hypothetical protein
LFRVITGEIDLITEEILTGPGPSRGHRMVLVIKRLQLSTVVRILLSPNVRR